MTKKKAIKLAIDALERRQAVFVVGYNVHFDTTKSNIFYSNTLDVGDVTEYELQSLQEDTKYYISVTCYDTDGNQSWFAKSVSVYTGDPVNVYETDMAMEESIYANDVLICSRNHNGLNK